MVTTSYRRIPVRPLGQRAWELRGDKAYRVWEALYCRHPVLVCASTMALAGMGMLLAVTISTLAVMLPLCLLFDWI